MVQALPTTVPIIYCKPKRESKTAFHPAQVGTTMTIQTLFSQIRAIRCLHSEIPVEKTTAETLSRKLSIAPDAHSDQGPVITLGVVQPDEIRSLNFEIGDEEEWCFIRASETNGIELYVSHTWFLFRFACRLLEDWTEESVASFASGKVFKAAFKHLRPAYDTYLNNHARTAKNHDPEAHIRELARLGYTHVEVNGFGVDFPYERAAPDELLYRFYTYCAALDQYVYSRLNKGIYPKEYLQANLNKLKQSARLAEKYGLRAGILTFEPRSVPDELLERYPMLRGARVDHPLRSFRPRYNLSTAHPVVLDHYSEMLEKILQAAPNIDYICVWSNDSGAGFEYTSSLYVGRNGGGYLIREWKGDDAIARAAADNIVRFMRTLRDAGRRVNPNFRSVLRSEIFGTERDYIWEQSEEGLDHEVNTLKAKGFAIGYPHPKYDWADEDFYFSALFNQFDADEKPVKKMLEAKGSDVHLYFSPGASWEQEPIAAPIYPGLLHDKLKALHAQGVTHAAALNGTTPPTIAPYNINQEVTRSFQNDPTEDLPSILHRTARRWVGNNSAADLVQTWMHADEAYRSFPPPVSILAVWGTWYRTLVRPFVPNFEALTADERAYYEDFHLGHANNRIQVDFRREVNFDFCTPEYAHKCRAAMLEHVFPEIAKAVEIARHHRDQAPAGSKARDAWAHHYDLLKGTQCWYRTQRNVAGWIEGVHGYIEAKDEASKQTARALTRETVLDEKANAIDLLAHVRSAETAWMVHSKIGETTFIYGENFAELVEKKIALMEGREDDEPYIDPDFMWRVPGINC